MCWNDRVKACDENVQESGRVGISSCTTTMPPPTQPSAFSSFWLETKWWLCLTPPTHLTLLLATFFCTHRWSRIWKGGILLILQRLNENCWRPLTAFPLKILDNFSSSGSSAGITASSHRGSTLKGTRVTNSYKYFKYIFCNNPRNFFILPRTWIHITEQQCATTSTRFQRNVLQISSVKLGSTPVLHLRVLSSNLDLVTDYSQVLWFSSVSEQKAMIIPQKLPSTC